MNFLKKKTYYLFLTLFVLSFFVFSFVSAGISDAFKVGSGGALDEAASEMGYTTGNKASSVEEIVAMVIQAVLSILGVVFIVFIVYGGVLWMTAGGNDERVGRAQNLIKRALIGLIIVLLSYAISVFIINTFLNTSA